MSAERFHAERKVRTYRNALLGLAGLLLLSLSGNLATDFKDAIPQRRVVLSYLKVAASLPTSVKDSPDPVSLPGLARCAVAPSGAEACWELADPAMTVISNDILQSIPTPCNPSLPRARP